MVEPVNLSEIYRLRFSEEMKLKKLLIWEVICKNYLSRYIPYQSTVLDIGSGYGEFLNNISANKKIGLDLNPDAGTYLSGDSIFINCNATNLLSRVNYEVDVVFTSNFLEHLPNKNAIDSLLKQVLGILKNDGIFIIMGPNLRYLNGKYWDFYDHHVGLTHLSLIEALKIAGFNIEVCVDKFLPYTTQGSLPTNPLLVRLYLAFPPLWRIFGKQFFVVAKKP